MVKINGIKYKLIFLDTNALTVILLDESKRKRFFDKFLSDEQYIPVFSIYNVYEIYPKKDIFTIFVDFFSIIPTFLLFPYKLILEGEAKAFNLKYQFELSEDEMHAFSILGGENRNFRKFIDDYFMKYSTDIKRDIDDIYKTADVWEKRRLEEKMVIGHYSRVELIKLLKVLEKETIEKDLKKHDIIVNRDIDIRRFPGIRVMIYSLFSKMHFSNKPIIPNDVMDVKISCVVPYVDAIITESYQAEVYKQLKSHLKDLEYLSIYKLSCLKD